MKTMIAVGLLSLCALTAFAGEPRKDAGTAPVPATRSGEPSDETLRAEGEQRFRTNCSRCHQAPHKFPPRMMATIERHMRVRALITDEDLHLILRYMTQ